ncbi:hypothetical protein E3N88_27294 [Mikania micrantha]|uniref:Uncharacterized protein n=1 Tax=Mikania micrantha TaxID=192012 RepID=A0A5N6MW85_9ASTR|nr:hypothetical protein E3N88_27294 [Mikania micrantha]
MGTKKAVSPKGSEFVTKEATGAVLVEDVDQPSTPSSTIYCNSAHGNCKAGCSWDTHAYNNEETKNNNIIEMSLEYEVEFWNMLEPQVITDHEMLEVENWMRSLEQELGLVGSATDAGHQD